jgi:hypothetical protein
MDEHLLHQDPRQHPHDRAKQHRRVRLRTGQTSTLYAYA